MGIRPAALGIILAVMVSLSSTNYVLNGGVSIKAILLGLLSLYLLMKQKCVLKNGSHNLSMIGGLGILIPTKQ